MYLFLNHDMKVEDAEFRRPPPEVSDCYGPEFKCSRCGAPGLRWWRNPEDKPMPVNAHGRIHTCGGK